jgi:hypothetical protein
MEDRAALEQLRSHVWAAHQRHPDQRFLEEAALLIEHEVVRMITLDTLQNLLGRGGGIWPAAHWEQVRAAVLKLVELLEAK